MRWAGSYSQMQISNMSRKTSSKSYNVMGIYSFLFSTCYSAFLYKPLLLCSWSSWFRWADNTTWPPRGRGIQSCRQHILSPWLIRLVQKWAHESRSSNGTLLNVSGKEELSTSSGLMRASLPQLGSLPEENTRDTAHCDTGETPDPVFQNWFPGFLSYMGQ